jgi:rubrerythrin
MKEYSKREWKKIFEDSIMDELCDAAYYHRMATMAPDYEAKDIILNIAADEECHARKLMDAYEGLFGIRYKKPSQPSPKIKDYKRALDDRFHEEVNANRKYEEYYLASGSHRLRDLWFDIMHDENRHALYMLYLKNKCCC